MQGVNILTNVLMIFLVFLDLVYKCKINFTMKKDFSKFMYFTDTIYDLIVN